MRQWHEALASKTMIQTHCSRFPKNLEREAESIAVCWSDRLGREPDMRRSISELGSVQRIWVHGGTVGRVDSRPGERGCDGRKVLAVLLSVGLTLPEAKQLLAGVQLAVVSAQAISHGLQRPWACHLKDWRGHHIATLFGDVTVRLPPFSKHRLQSHRDERRLAIALPIDT